MKPAKPDLETDIFAHRRYFEIDHYQNDTLEQRRKRERIGKWVCGILAIVFTPILIALFAYTGQNYTFHEPLPSWFDVLFICVCSISMLSICLSMAFLVLPKQCYGRWIIVNAGIFYRYGKSPHCFIPFSSLRNVHVERPKSSFAVVVFETNQEPLRIAECTFSSSKRNSTDFLPFLNFLIDRLQQNGWKETDLTPLLELQRKIQGRYIWGRYFQYTQWLMLTCFMLPMLCVLPFYRFICMFSYPAIRWVVILCCLVVTLIGLVLNSRCERWTNKKVAEKLRSLKHHHFAQMDSKAVINE